MANRVCARCGAPAQAGRGTCATCGWPLGAKATGTAGGSSTVLIAVAGCLVAMAILGIISAILIPNFVDAVQKGRQKRTFADMRVIAEALEAYAASDYAVNQDSRYPDAGSIEDLDSHLVPVFLDPMPSVDGWGNPLRYLCVRPRHRDQGCESYRLVSAGRDGAFSYESGETDLFDQKRFGAGEFDEDLVFGPEGIVHGPSGFS